MGDVAEDAIRRAEEEVEEGEIEEARHLPAVRAHDAIVARAEITVDDVVAQREKILDVQKAVMRETVHYGKIPGISKPSLFKPGAEVLCTTFRFAPSYQRTLEWLDRGDGSRHLIVESNCTLTHAPSGVVLGSAGGMCSTLESKYAYRQGMKQCLECGQPLRKSKKGAGEWYCWNNPSRGANGCGAKFALDNPSIEAQSVERIDNPDLGDVYNTVLKMADKRALVAAILVCTAASEVFTQDVEDNASTAVSEATPANGESANGAALRKMRLDIQDLWRKLDQKRKVEGGTTFAESERVVARWYGELEWDALDEEQTVRLGTALGGYLAYLTQKFPEGVVPNEFDVWVAQDEAPF